jgi:hypothetical protein
MHILVAIAEGVFELASICAFVATLIAVAGLATGHF